MLQHIRHTVLRVQSAAVASNPYESPAPDAGQHSTLATALRYLVAIAFWLASLLPVLAYFLIASRPDIVAKRDANLPMCVAVCGTMFALPAIGLALFGAAIWRRSKWLALAGSAGFLPIIHIGLWQPRTDGRGN
jgi:hypothetical protein